MVHNQWCIMSELTLKNMQNLNKRLGFHLEKIKRFQEAMTHSSCEEKINNKKLAFLGDAILDLAVSQYLISRFPEITVGELTKRRASMVNSRFLAKKAREWKLSKYLKLGKGEKQMGGEEKETILAEAVEALIGAIYLDSGFDRTAHFIERNGIPETLDITDWNAKGRLQEFALAGGVPIPRYSVLEEKGNGNSKQFEIAVSVDGNILGTGKGKNKKEAEMKAAEKALKIFNDENRKRE